MDKSVVSRILTTFKLRDYVRVVADGRYDLGLRLFELGQVLQERMPFRETVIPHIDGIAAETGETAFAVHYTKGRIACLYDCVSAQDIRLGPRRQSRGHCQIAAAYLSKAKGVVAMSPSGLTGLRGN